MWCILTVYDIRIAMDVEMVFLAVLFLGVVQSNTGLFGGTIIGLVFRLQGLLLQFRGLYQLGR